MAARKTQGADAAQKKKARIAAQNAKKNKAAVHAATVALGNAQRALAKAQKALSGVPGGPPKINT